MRADIYWIEGIAPHRIATMPGPAGDRLEDEIRSLKSEGVDALVSLLTTGEVFYMELEQEPESCRACGIEYISFPIPDRQTPESEAATLDLVERLAALVTEGKGVAIHCFAGIGRSTLIAACVLANLGIDPGEAFRLIKRSRGCDVPDTPEQKEWVYWFASTMLSRPSETA
jgi:protein-tyrosine phosphatase